jgi:hypothetical protein
MDKIQGNHAFTEYLHQTIIDETARIDELLTEARQADNMMEELEELERSAFALQVARDILENRVTPGKKVTINYPKGQLILE